MNWVGFAAAAPELAELGRERLESHHLCLVGTLREDGWPRISPVETFLVDGELMLGMMPRSRKAMDLLRDPRIAIHSVVTDWSGTEGDFKLFGNAIEVRDVARRVAFIRTIEAAHGWPQDPDAEQDDGSHMFSVDIASAAFVRFAKGEMELWRWNPKDGIRREARSNE